MVKIGLVGFISSGKSSVYNSLVGAHMAPIGIARTTVDQKEGEFMSDDKIQCKIIDTPGMSDADDIIEDFDKLAYRVAETCDIVLWVSDINRAFITKSEVEAYTKFSAHIMTLCEIKGATIQLGILLTKCDFDLNYIAAATTAGVSIRAGELPPVEDTDAIDNYKKVCERYNSGSVEVIAFNAHGRAMYGANSSATLAQLVRRYCPTNNNIAFNIKPFTDRLPEVKYLYKSFMPFAKELVKCFINDYRRYITYQSQNILFNNGAGHSVWDKMPSNSSFAKEPCGAHVNKKLIVELINKQNLILTNFIVKGEFITNVKFDGFDEVFWSMVCCKENYKEYIINVREKRVKPYISVAHFMPQIAANLSRYEAFRLLQVGADLTQYQKLAIYAAACGDFTSDVQIPPFVAANGEWHTFVFAPIMRVEDIDRALEPQPGKLEVVRNDSGTRVKIVHGPAGSVDNEPRQIARYTTDLFDADLIDRVIKIRTEVFKKVEPAYIILAAYEKYGLFWAPK